MVFRHLPTHALTLVLSLLSLVASSRAEEPSGPVFELRTYVCEPGKLAALHERFRNHTMKLFAKHGMVNVGYWVPAEGPESETTLVYLLRHESREAARASWQAFKDDPEWQRVAKESEERHGKILARRPDSVYLSATEYSPVIAAMAESP